MLGVNIVEFVLVLMFLVLVHEAGHMVAAKWCGMRVERFSIFFGKPFAKFTRGDTEYGIGWLPLGGYVRITGMSREEDLTPDLVPRSYYAAKTWKKVVVIAAGPAVNLVVALLCFAIYFWVGIPGFGGVAIDGVKPAAPAAVAGLVAGDQLVSVNGISVSRDDASATRALDAIQTHPGRPVVVRFTHAGSDTVITKSITPRPVTVGGTTVGRIGVNLMSIPGPRESAGPIGGITLAGRYTWVLVKANVDGVAQMFTSSKAREQVGSVVAIGAAYNQIASDGLMEVIRFIGLISLVLAIFNLLPIFPLDGGHILFALIEKVRGRPISTRVYERAGMVGWAVLLLVFVFALQNDIGKILGGGFTFK